ncbi:MAG TPA: cation:proton antiporter [Nevskiaceae bacterium]|nr:cation:proton antiporter [Nevskiaceae bacterium]
MEGAALVEAKDLLGQFTIAVAAGAIGSAIARRLRIPDVAVFLLIGIALGPQLLDWLHIGAESMINQLVLVFGASFILFDGGAGLRFAVLREVWITIVVIATIGVLITAAITGFAARALFDVPLLTALLLGCVLASTDPATLVPIFKQVKIRDRVEQTVISESAFNDAMAAILTFTVLGIASGTAEFSAGRALVDLLRDAGLGIGVGALAGFAGAALIGHRRVGWLADVSPLVVAIGVGAAYLAAEKIGGSGFMAVFLFGLIVGNREAFGFAMAPHEEAQMHHFVHSTALFMRLLIFILLGSQVNFALIARYWLPGLALMAVFMLIARPVTVFACAAPDRRARWSASELLFMCWARETGVIPAALAGMLVGMNAPGAEMIASVTFIAVLVTILIQAPTTRWLAARLGLLA